MFNILKDVCQELCGETWTTKLLSAAKDGASNMTRRFQDAVRRLEQVSVTGVFRICYTFNQFDLIAQSLMRIVLKQMFFEPMIHLFHF